MKPAANLTLLWPELPFFDRYDAAAIAGFKAVEVLFPYDLPAPTIQNALQTNGLEMVLINAPPPNYTGSERGFAAAPGAEERFKHDMRRVFRYAQVLGVSFVHVMTGDDLGDACHATLVENLTWAAKTAPPGLTLTLEPLCSATMPGYFLNDYALAADILAQVDAPNLGLQFDSFHAQMIHRDAVATYEKHRHLVRHVQVGDTPKRGTPGTGDVDFTALFGAMRDSSYAGWVSGEYHPDRATEKTFDWMRRL